MPSTSRAVIAAAEALVEDLQMDEITEAAHDGYGIVHFTYRGKAYCAIVETFGHDDD